MTDINLDSRLIQNLPRYVHEISIGCLGSGSVLVSGPVSTSTLISTRNFAWMFMFFVCPFMNY
jgi:hypothetical protein